MKVFTCNISPHSNITFHKLTLASVACVPSHYINAVSQFLHKCVIFQTMHLQCKYSAHLLKSEIANHRMETILCEVSESHGVKIFILHLKSFSADSLAKIKLLLTKEEKEAYIIHTSKENQEFEGPLRNL